MSIPRSSTARRSLDSLQHLALDVDRAIQAFVVNGGVPGGTEMFYQTLSNPTEVAKNVIYITMTLVGDTFVTYRLFVVWNHSWLIIVLPVTMLLATAGAPPPLFSRTRTDTFYPVAGYGACVEIGLVKGVGAIFAENLQPWIRAFFSLSLTTNLIATCEYSLLLRVSFCISVLRSR